MQLPLVKPHPNMLPPISILDIYRPEYVFAIVRCAHSSSQPPTKSNLVVRRLGWSLLAEQAFEVEGY
jgi:hypothetical protein